MTREEYANFVKINNKIEDLAYTFGQAYADKENDDWKDYLIEHKRENEITYYKNRFFATNFEFYEDVMTFYIADTENIIDNKFIKIPINDFIEWCKIKEN